MLLELIVHLNYFKMNRFENVKQFLMDKYDPSKVVYVTRKELLDHFKVSYSSRYSTIDQYRNHFTKAGYLSIVGRGKYLLLKSIPKDLKARELRKEAYPHWPEWNEYSHIKERGIRIVHTIIETTN